MRFEPRRAFFSSSVAPPARTIDDVLPIEIAFLQGMTANGLSLRRAALIARRSRVCAARVVIAEGIVSESLYYQALAHHLRLDYNNLWPRLAAPIDAAAIAAKGRARLADDGWIVAPQGAALRRLLTARAAGFALPAIAITSPSHLRALVLLRGGLDVVERAADRLPDVAPALSAKRTGSRRPVLAMCLVLVAAILGLISGVRIIADIFGLIFGAGMVLRLLICAAGLYPSDAAAPLMKDADLPNYSILVPLKDEADIVPDLVFALDRLDYPRAKLEALFLIEPEDSATRAALAASAMPPWCHIIVGPTEGCVLRTKPRALNIGLLFARGALITVFDAEDRPAHNQLRLAAARFQAEPDLDCLQARLAIGNGGASPWSRLFALEYAALFDLFNIGTAELSLPMALGGTSNHFRTSVLRAVGGWDAWNVTEDADLGLRLARFGYRVGGLASTTMEDGPERFGAWMKQRRRWTKGWMQTLLVLAWDAPAACRHYGPRDAILLVLLLTNLVTGPLLLPLFSLCVVYHFARQGLPAAGDFARLLEATLWGSVVVLGTGSTLWGGGVGLRRRRLGAFVLSVPLLLPYQLMISGAAWIGLYDLLVKPFHWHKTAHGRGARRRP